MAFIVPDVSERNIAFNGEELTIQNRTSDTTDTDTDTVTPGYTELGPIKATIDYITEKKSKLIAMGYKPDLDIVVKLSPSTIINASSYFTWDGAKYTVDRLFKTRFYGANIEQDLICKRESKS